MAETFEPTVPKEQPADYVFWARPGGSVIANTGKGKALSNLGRGIEDATRVATGITETNIEGDTARGVDKILDDWQGRLQPVYDSITGQQKDFDVLSPTSGQEQVPANLQRRIEGFDRLDQLMASGKYSEAYVKTQVARLAKGVRADYPGFREDVDRKTNEKFGRGIANRSIEAMQSVINSYIGKRDEFKNKLDAQLLQEIHGGNTDAVPWLQRRQPGANNPMSDLELATNLARANSQERSLKLKNAERNQIKDDREMAKYRAQDIASDLVSNKQYWFVHNWHSSIGAPTVNEMITKLQNDKTLTQEQRQNIAEQIMNAGNIFRQKMVDAFNQKDGGGRSLSQDLGGYDEIDKGMTTFKDMAEWFKNGEWGPLKATANYIKTKEEDTTKAFIDGDAGAYALLANTINHLAGQNTKWADEMTNIGQQRFIDKNINSFLEHRTWQVMGQNGMFNGQPIDPSHPLTFQKVIEDTTERLGRAGIKSDSKTASDVYAAEIGVVKQLTNPSAPAEAKKNIAAAAFDPNNSLKVFNKDSQDANGNPLIGQATIYSIMTTPNMDKEIFGKPTYTPEERKRYADWKVNQFVNVVFPTEIADLNKYGDDPHVKIGWNDKTHNLEVKPVTRDDPSEGQLQMGRPNWQVIHQNVSNAVWRLNMGLSNLANMAKYTKQDPNEFIAMVLSQNHGLSGPIMDKIRAGVTATLGQQNDNRVQ